MRLIRIYQPGQYSPGDIIELTPEAGQHVGVVLRKQPGYRLCLFPGNNLEFEAEIVQAHKKRVAVKIISGQERNRESPIRLHLVQGVSKGERMEVVVQKAAELGVASITPVLTDYCAVKLDEERMRKKQAQWQLIAISACEQSGRNTIPLIQPIIPFTGFLKQMPAGASFVLSPTADKHWRDYQCKDKEIYLFIGPEGGFSDEELDQLIQNHCAPLSLGPRVLRTETAAIAALSILQAVWGDL
ncbi:16S ribosomal RNA methyltransferase RsmE [Legionella quinlivanii]|uniref:Ribosomal RNA small subunit methyltransferase E n=1 Tax=Legionella quinlivanii TaxID=45073 RepID=A0A0W0Y5U4_9GAMM|nr:16S rRNA (uracil(1498)-N(3))-methyltransferase [Legionella quinlivanii]KTD52020.1 16S ribosomal RNA methyltransferase RsmE [Legionella quinlivanii]SEF87800.1 16S rRNA m(3)U-1498 methyltransferase [Legionella quinlivanii DSM 21216]STY12485.1 Ribosomal RNA small subunit methyltransferase E (16S rRNA m3U1498 methyltransferase) [Legionella quinlivanii]